MRRLVGYIDVFGVPRVQEMNARDVEYCQCAGLELLYATKPPECVRGAVPDVPCAVPAAVQLHSSRPSCSVCEDNYEGCSKNYSGGWCGTRCPN